MPQQHGGAIHYSAKQHTPAAPNANRIMQLGSPVPLSCHRPAHRSSAGWQGSDGRRRHVARCGGNNRCRCCRRCRRRCCRGCGRSGRWWSGSRLHLHRVVVRRRHGRRHRCRHWNSSATPAAADTVAYRARGAVRRGAVTPRRVRRSRCCCCALGCRLARRHGHRERHRQPAGLQRARGAPHELEALVFAQRVA